MDKAYIETVRLLLDAAPAVFEYSFFAMKGGTAISLFLEDMPRLSVDIDVVFTDFKANRQDALAAISTALESSRTRLSSRGLLVEIISTKDGKDLKMFIRRGRSQVKVEVNSIFRGTLLPVDTRSLRESARKLFTSDLSVPILAEPELYGSKLVAAMDRQHPRDFFDVRGMFQRNDLSKEVVECFVCYLAGHNRPVHEVLFSRDLALSIPFNNEFIGMTRDSITLKELEDTRARLKEELPLALTANQRKFLLSLVSGEPDWSLMSCRHLSEMPPVHWKLQNIENLKRTNSKKFVQQRDALNARFNI